MVSYAYQALDVNTNMLLLYMIIPRKIDFTQMARHSISEKT